MSLVDVVVPEGVGNPSRPSGGNTYDRMLSSGLARRGWVVRVHEVPGRSGQDGTRFTASALASVLARLRTGDAVVVDGLVCCDHPDVLARESGRLRLVVLVHLPLGLDGSDEGVAQARTVEGEALRSVAGVVATSRWTQRWLLDTYGLEPARVAVAVPGVERGEVVPGSPDGRRLLCVGAVVPAKGHDVLVEALALVPVAGWALECVGTLERDPAFVERLRRRAGVLGVADRVRFAGPLVGAELDAAHARADLVVSASHGETYGMAVTEALGRGLPVLATRVGGVPEALGLAPGERCPGLLVPPADPGALAEALEQWLGDPVMRDRLRRAALDRRAGLPTWSSTCSAVARVLGDLAA